MNDPTAWPDADETITAEDPKYGQWQVIRWSNFHFKLSSTREMAIIRVKMVTPVGQKRKFQPLWLAWLGQTMPELKTLSGAPTCVALPSNTGTALLSNDGIGHNTATTRFCPDSFRVVLQLWLARTDCLDHPLPWQRTQDNLNLAPGCVAQLESVLPQDLAI